MDRERNLAEELEFHRAMKAIASYLYRVSPKDPLLFVGAAFLLLSVAASASVLPARRAAKTDALTAIRYE